MKTKLSIRGLRKIYDNYEYYSENSKKLSKRYDLKIIKKRMGKIIKGDIKNEKNRNINISTT